MIGVPPWARGPLELLRHAEGHLRGGGDTDRRIALIGFDQTVETSIEVYVRLHPRLRKGKELQRDVRERALQSFHSKIEFLETHLREEARDLGVSIEAIVWYHSLRNELYHSGNGMVPELHVLEGAREAAVRVFAAVFGEEHVSEFTAGPGSGTDPDAAVAPSDDPTMHFLSQFIEFERLLRGRVAGANRRDLLRMVWRRFQKSNPDLDPLEADIELVTSVRNHIVHAGPRELTGPELQQATDALWRLAEAIRGREG